MGFIFLEDYVSPTFAMPVKNMGRAVRQVEPTQVEPIHVQLISDAAVAERLSTLLEWRSRNCHWLRVSPDKQVISVEGALRTEVLPLRVKLFKQKHSPNPDNQHIKSR